MTAPEQPQIVEWGIRCNDPEHVSAGTVYMTGDEAKVRAAARTAHGELVSRPVGEWTAVPA